jgi:hypothetical protein
LPLRGSGRCVAVPRSSGVSVRGSLLVLGRLAISRSPISAELRVLAALNQAADQEPTVRALFNELLDGFIAELGTLLVKLKIPPTEARIDLLHALFVGLSIIDLATRRKNGRARAKAALDLGFDLLSGEKR